MHAVRSAARAHVTVAALAGGAAACSLFGASLDKYESVPPDAGIDAAPDGGQCGDTTLSSTSCGACGHDCQGAACVGGFCAPEVVVSGDDQSGPPGPGRGYPVFLAIGGGRMFWLDAFTAIKTRPIDGGIAAWTPLPAVGLPQQAFSLSLNPTSAFVSTVEGNPRYRSHVFRVAQAAVGNAAATVDELATQPDVNHIVTAVRADANAVYWAVHDGAGTMAGSIDTAPPDAPVDAGGTVAQGNVKPRALGVTPTALVWIERAGDVGVTRAAGVLTASRTGGGPRVLDVGIIPFDLLAVGPDAYFPWVDGQTTSIRRSTLDGAKVDTLVPSVTLSGDVLFTDGATLVWSTIDAQASNITLWVCALASSAKAASCASPVAVASLALSVRAKLGAVVLVPSVAIDGEWLYWAEPTNQVIRRVSIRGR